MKRMSLCLLMLIVLCAGALAACRRGDTAVATLAATAAPPEQAAGAEVTGATSEATAVAEVAPTPDALAATATPVPTDTPAPTPTPEPTPTPAPPPAYGYEIINTYPHDPEAFTQGLVFLDGRLYEGTGRWGESSLREVTLESGGVVRSRALETQYFGEGIAILGDRVYQITWQEGTGFVYDLATFEPLQTFTYDHEGWGITHDGTQLIVSDGSPVLRFWDPATLQETGRITVRDNNGPVNRLNELEYVNGEIWANIWLTDLIARISPETGDVLGYIDLTGLLDPSTLAQPVDVLNGIAYDAAGDRLFVTGKLWPSLFEIRIVPQS